MSICWPETNSIMKYEASQKKNKFSNNHSNFYKKKVKKKKKLNH